jgi:hypothetical protein
MKYYLIRNSDGDTSVSQIDKEKFLASIEDGDYGESPEFLDSLVGLSDTNYWGDKMLLIKGEIVTLKKKEVVTKYDID